MTLYLCPGCGRFHDDGEYVTSHFDEPEDGLTPEQHKALTLIALKSSRYPTGGKAYRLNKPKGFKRPSKLIE